MSMWRELSARDEGDLEAFLERGNLLAMAKAFDDAGVECIEDVLQLEAATIQQITEGKPAWATRIKQAIIKHAPGGAECAALAALGGPPPAQPPTATATAFAAPVSTSATAATAGAIAPQL